MRRKDKGFLRLSLSLLSLPVSILDTRQGLLYQPKIPGLVYPAPGSDSIVRSALAISSMVLGPGLRSPYGPVID